MSNTELLKTFLNGVTSNDNDAAKSAFAEYCNNKAKIMTNRRKVMERVEAFKAELVEYGLNHVPGRLPSSDTARAKTKAANQEPIRMEGDKIFVNGKMVGRIDYDMDDWEGGINFVSDDGAYSREFDTAEALFQFISKKFLGENNV